jgi:D-amino-acid dehydrogenase
VQRIIIAGGGVVGLSCGIALARAGHGVTVLDPDPARAAASWGNAGHIAIEQVAPLASPAAVRSAWSRRFGAGGALDLPPARMRDWLPFAARLLAASRPARFRAGTAALTALMATAMPAWQRLVQAIDAPDLLKIDGHLIAWESAASAAKGLAAWQAADTGTARIAPADARDRAALDALVAIPLGGAARFTGSGQIAYLGRLATALEGALIRAGGRLCRERAVLEHAKGRASVRGHDADLVLVAAGIRSRALLTPLGHRVPMIAERGYHIRAALGDRWPTTMPPVVFEDRSMIVTRYADSVQAASFVELGDPDAPADPRKWQRLEAHVAALGLPVTGPFTRWMGARPTLPDYLPAIGRSRRADNLLYAFGHQHLGLTLAPATAELVAALVDGRTPGVDLNPFDLERFGGDGR